MGLPFMVCDLHNGPIIGWGGEAKNPSGIAYSPRYCGVGLFALNDRGEVLALVHDNAEADSPLRWVEVGR